MIKYTDISSRDNHLQVQLRYKIFSLCWYICIIFLFLVPAKAASQSADNDISVTFNELFERFPTGWSGDTHLFSPIFKGTEGYLQQISGSESGNNEICHPSNAAFGKWEFSVNFDAFQTSNQNHALVWIQRLSPDSNQGIIVRIGENGNSKRIRLLASDHNATLTEILTTSQILPLNLTTIHVRIIRSPQSRWTLDYSFNSSGIWHSDQVSAPAQLLPESWFCLSTRYTPTRVDKFSFGPITISTPTTFLSHYTTPAPDQLHLHFSKLLSPQNTAAAVSIQQYTGSISTTILKNQLQLTLNPAPGGGTRQLTINGLIDFETSPKPFHIETPIRWFDNPHPLDIVINEFIPRPTTPAEAFLELKNTSNRYLDLNGWSVGRASAQVTLTHPRTIKPGDLVVLQSNAPQDPDSGSIHYLSVPLFTLGRTQDRIWLRDPSAKLIDSIRYASPTSSRWTDGRSVEKVDASYSGMDPTNWDQHPTGSTIGAENYHRSSPRPPPHINVARVVSDAILLTFNQFLKWNANASVQIGPHSYVLAEWNPFESNQVTIPLLPEVVLHTQPIWITMDHVSQFDSNIPLSFQTELAQPPIPGDLIINEIMYQPIQNRYLSGSDQSEFIEIHNIRPWRISLTDIILRDPIDKHGQFPYLSPESPETWVIESNDYALLVADTTNIANSRTAIYFGLQPNASWGHARRSSLSLSTLGKTILLSNYDGLAFDSVAYHPSMHHPLLRDQRGRSLERINGKHGESLPFWTSSADPLGATPGKINSQSVNSSDVLSKNGLHIYPNPFSPDLDGFDDTVEISLQTDEPGLFSRITIYDLRGRRIRTLLNDGLTATVTSVIWDGKDDWGMIKPTGVYIVLAESYNHTNQRTKTFKNPVVLVRKR